MNEGLLPLGIATLGAACLCVFVAARPWPASPEGKPISAGAYVVDLAKGNVPAASISPKASGQQAQQNTEIQNGLSAALLVWLVSKLAAQLSAIFVPFFGS